MHLLIPNSYFIPTLNGLIQWLGLQASTAAVIGSIPGWETKIPQTTWSGQENKKQTHKKANLWDFPGRPMVKALPSNTRGESSLLVWKLRSPRLRSQKPKSLRSNIITNSIKTLKIVLPKINNNLKKGLICVTWTSVKKKEPLKESSNNIVSVCMLSVSVLSNSLQPHGL